MKSNKFYPTTKKDVAELKKNFLLSLEGSIKFLLNKEVGIVKDGDRTFRADFFTAKKYAKAYEKKYEYPCSYRRVRIINRENNKEYSSIIDKTILWPKRILALIMTLGGLVTLGLLAGLIYLISEFFLIGILILGMIVWFISMGLYSYKQI